jgi:hypothetical protein
LKDLFKREFFFFARGFELLAYGLHRDK